ncbi:hypothetical protein [Flavobacterium sp. TAB 87]|uniref:hypothetical protein n=1 Tax=Flavobacterium sp. TAB 87 TaxID=1729581 RepID=UPI00082A7A01|nr:hypothetical protein [Flavobacterium sp. TAB 87]
MRRQFNLVFMTILLPFFTIANTGNWAVTKQKTIKKTYLVNSDAGITIDNKYGNISVTTWNEDKIDLDIIIKVSGNKESWVNERINTIDVTINALKSMVSAQTEFGNLNNNSSRTNSFEINYVIKIPKNGSIKLNNKYGNITISNAESSTDIFCKYGKINLGKLNGTKNTIQIEYCNDSNIDYIKSGAIIAKYSDFQITTSDKLELLSDYTDVNIQNVDNLRYTSKYGTIKINSVRNLDAISNYLTLRVDELRDQFKITAKYSEIKVGIINAIASNVTINAAYTDISLGFQSNYPFDFAVDTKYSNFKYGSELEFNSKDESNNSKSYQGFYKKKGINKLSIASSYGNVSLIKKQ